MTQTKRHQVRGIRAGWREEARILRPGEWRAAADKNTPIAKHQWGLDQ
jgi:hypothetical protein